MGTLERVLSQVNSPSLSQVQQSPYQVASQPATQLSNQSLQAQPWAYQEQQVAPAFLVHGGVRKVALVLVQARLVDLDELVVGTICGGSDSTRGLTANPAIGKAADILVDAGGIRRSGFSDVIRATSSLSSRRNGHTVS